MNVAPATAPPATSSPPMTTIARYSMDSATPNVSGTMRRNAMANSTPPSPAYIDEIRNA